jgi:uncharacterized membrane protein
MRSSIVPEQFQNTCIPVLLFRLLNTGTVELIWNRYLTNTQYKRDTPHSRHVTGDFRKDVRNG